MRNRKKRLPTIEELCAESLDCPDAAELEITAPQQELGWRMKQYMEREHITIEEFAWRCHIPVGEAEGIYTKNTSLLVFCNICEGLGIDYPLDPPQDEDFKRYLALMEQYQQAKQDGDTHCMADSFQEITEMTAANPVQAQRWQFWAEWVIGGCMPLKKRDGNEPV